MLWREVIYLISVTTTTNDMSDSIEGPIQKQVFANKKSIRQSEFYQAMATGLRPELMFEVKSIDYQQESKLSYNGMLYTIIRAYDKNGEITELICQGIVNGVIINAVAEV